jgi:hypothetical protein
LIGSEIGILELYQPQNDDKIIIYNEDDSIWMDFDFSYEDKFRNQGKSEFSMSDIKKLYNWQDDFKPYKFNIDYFLLLFKCLSFDGKRYSVIVNDQKNLIKYIDAGNIWKLRDWNDHIINKVASIGIEFDAIKIKSKPDNQSDDIDFDVDKLDPAIDPVEIKDEWMKIRYWQSDQELYGWIKWKEGNQILVSLWYLM